jgi:hypothetical protein
MEQSEGRKPRHVTRSTQGQPKEEETKTYRVKVGQVWGTNPELQPGDTVELTEAEAAGFEDKLEQVGVDAGRQPSGDAATRGQLPAGAVSATTETVSPPVVDDSQAGKPGVPRGTRSS